MTFVIANLVYIPITHGAFGKYKTCHIKKCVENSQRIKENTESTIRHNVRAEQSVDGHISILLGQCGRW
jgi:predicted RNase H-related nuclease YkuK (DUF458 family)